MTHPAYFIVLEGIDGSGKTRQCAAVADWLRDCGRTVFECADGTSGTWGKAAMRALHARSERPCPIDDVLTDDEYLLACFVKSRADLALKIVDLLASGQDVVCDRWEPSTWAYQLAAGIPTSRVLRWVRRHAPVVQPDVTIWLRLHPQRALERVLAAARAGQRVLTPRFENAAFLEEVASCYEGMPGLTPILGSQPAEDVTRAIITQLRLAMLGLARSRVATRCVPTGAAISVMPPEARDAWALYVDGGRPRARARELRQLAKQVRRARMRSLAPARASRPSPKDTP